MAHGATALANSVQPSPRIEPSLRRFGLADLSQHGAWVLPRLIKAYPHLNERTAAGWLRGILESDEFLFLYQPHSVGCAQIMRAHTLAPNAVVYERFVFAQSEDHLEEAAAFYEEFKRWAKLLSARTIIVEECTDVLHEQIRARLGTIHNTAFKFAKVS
jgi:hypothetical protein